MSSYGGVQMFMEKLKQLINCNEVPSINHPAIICERPQFQRLYDELDNPLIQSLFMNQHQHQLEKVADLKKRLIDAAEEAQYLVDHFLSAVLNRTTFEDLNPSQNPVDDSRSFKCVIDLLVFCFSIRDDEHFPTSHEDFNPSLNLDDVSRSFSLVKVELTGMNIGSMKTDSSPRPGSKLNQAVAAAPVSFTRNPQGSKKLMDEIVVGLHRDLKLIRDKLVEDKKKLEVVSIVGMGGIGKTTLATKVFNDSYVKHHFHVRVWVTVSQTYDKRDVLIQIIESIRGQLHLQKDNSDSRLREMVHKNLMDKRYLIVIDDIWQTETWDNLKLFFPHGNKGSRILLTTRLTEVAKHANSDGLIHHVGYLSKERSWELLCQKVFHGNKCPEWSIKPGMEIVESCKGLPLAVAVIGGVLAKEAMSEKFWVDIAEKTSSYIVGDQNGCLETLALSYNHLPLHLRECFLYFGCFPEDYKFKINFLIWLWVAEGFIEQNGDRSLEEIAEDYLMDLIDRNLVIVAHKSKINGAVRACKVHDLVRELCLKKGNEEQFFNQFYNDITTPPARMFINKDVYIRDFAYPSVKNLRAVLCFSRLSDNFSRFLCSFELLRVLDLQDCELDAFPKGLELLVHLRYLAIWEKSKGSVNDFLSSICNLWNLQTLIYVAKAWNIDLPKDLVNLRHLWNKGWSVVFPPSIERPMKLQSILDVTLKYGVPELQKCCPYLKDLQCSTSSTMKEYDFKSLTYLEKLRIFGFVHNIVTFPTTLKTLKLWGCDLEWDDMSIIQSLPNLQVLKIYAAFEGSCWNTDGHEFPQLKVLKLWGLDFQRWEAYSTTFPSLRRLELKLCERLAGIPLEFGEIPTLELIQIKYCSYSVERSGRRIQEEQHDFGNYDMKLDIWH